ncbi:MAG: bifunctional isocitrate dehydrogenase kinase/phosphatase [Gammaproteobacteria bacterium RIFCSPLOWO2_02_FULL_61_13]|nr:MAG: bifunctional isocitrate dehydrogenase kinase/phosphatase [Gammaproteobacteria bacterium RIFCSPLOWO2_02_FULL_61_13]
MTTSGKIVAESAQLIYDGFVRYNENFQRVTARARKRFETRDWKGVQEDLIGRVELYEKSVRRIVVTLQKNLGPRATDHRLWNDIRWYFGQRVQNIPDAGFTKTFFNSVTRRIFGTIGIDPEVEFVSPAPEEGSAIDALRLRHYPYWGSLKEIFAGVLNDFSFQVPYLSKDQDCERIDREINQYARIYLQEYGDFLRFEFIDSVFYQSARAYLVGRILQQHQITPIVIALENSGRGVRVDAVLLSEEEVSIVFSYTRSYYFADPNSVVGAVQFLHTILPRKPIDELYTVMGRLRQGKTERYRSFTNHLNNTDEKFVHAAGDKGLVMLVFNLPSYDLVFKIIRDKFGYPKTVRREDVVGKYRMISKHDRGGRLIDTQEFRNLELPLNRFGEELLDELQHETTLTTHIKGDQIGFDQCYIERRVRPLNLYINEVNRNEAQAAILDYGQAIRDLALNNIFPGDLLLKNFGVTRHRRIVFYDYDEVCMITDCEFRDLPEPVDDDDVMRPDAWFYVGEHDIFPEEFMKFLSMDADLREVFLQVHGDLLTARYWRDIKAMQLAGEAPLVVPYARPEIPATPARKRGAA